MKKRTRALVDRHAVKAGRELPDMESITEPQDQSSWADKEIDRRMANELTRNAGDSVLSRHRNGLTAIENESDGVSEDEDALEDAVTKESDENVPDGEEQETRE